MFESLNQDTFQAVKDLFFKRGFHAKTSEIDALEVCGSEFQIRVNQATFRAVKENVTGYHGKELFTVYRLQGGGIKRVSNWTPSQGEALQALVKAARSQRKRDAEIESEIEAAFDAMTEKV